MNEENKLNMLAELLDIHSATIGSLTASVENTIKAVEANSARIELVNHRINLLTARVEQLELWGKPYGK